MTLTTSASQTTQLTVVPISRTEWRISDPRRRSNDATCLVGFIQKVEGLFETTEIGRPRERHYYQSFDAAVSSLAVTRS